MGDYMVRATAANAQVRAFAVTTKELVETARQAHNTSPVVTAALEMCIRDSWSALPSRKGRIEDLSEQPNLVHLPAGKRYENTWSIEIF